MTKDLQELISIIKSKALTEESKVEQIQAILSENPELANAADEDGWAPLHAATHEKSVNVVSALIKHGADVNKKNNEGKTPLHINVGKLWCDTRITELLIGADADVNKKDNEGKTLLHITVEKMHYEAAKLLINAGADVSVKDNEGKTLLHIAVEKWYGKAAKLLIDAGADVNLLYPDGDSPLHKAADKTLELTQALLSAKNVDINRLDNRGNTALHRAVKSLNKNAVKALLEVEGIKLDFKDDQGKTPLHTAIEKWYDKEMTKWLIDAGAKVNIQDNNGKTPLHITIGKWDDKEMAKWLIDAGANVNIQDNNGKASLHVTKEIIKWLVDTGHEDVAKSLIRHALIQNIKEHDYLSEELSGYWKEFRDKCTTEIEAMKEQRISNSKVSFFDILIADKKKLAPCMNDDNIIKVLDTYDYEGNFSVYADKIKSQYTKGMNEKVAADIILNLNKNEDGDNVLVEDASRMVFNLLDYKEIRNLCKAGYQELIKKRHINTDALQRPVEDDKTVSSYLSDVGVEKYAKCVTQQNKI